MCVSEKGEKIMRVSGEFVLASVTKEPGFKDPTKMSNVVLFISGRDTLNFFVDDAMYASLVSKPLYKPYLVEMNFKPFAQKVQYAMDLLSVTDCK